MGDKKKVEARVQATANNAMRGGVYSNLVSIKSSQRETILDFYFIDGDEEEKDGSHKLTGLMQSRVVMSEEALIEFCETLNNHVEKDFKKDE